MDKHKLILSDFQRRVENPQTKLAFWHSGPESLFPGLAYIVFGGNVVGEDALARIARGLR